VTEPGGPPCPHHATWSFGLCSPNDQAQRPRRDAPREPGRRTTCRRPETRRGPLQRLVRLRRRCTAPPRSGARPRARSCTTPAADTAGPRATDAGRRPRTRGTAPATRSCPPTPRPTRTRPTRTTHAGRPARRRPGRATHDPPADPFPATLDGRSRPGLFGHAPA
jgi:uncharacterized membrane protein